MLLNGLAEELQLGVGPLRVKETKPSVVTRLVRLLESRCQDGNLPARLRAAVEQWQNNGGKLTRDVLPPATDAGGASQADSDRDDTVSLLPRHRVLDPGFRLQSKAFMLTYNSVNFTPELWTAFRNHMVKLHRALKSRAWAANWEQSLEAAGSANRPRFHGHGYMMWTDEVGLNRRNTDELVFTFSGHSVRPRVDACAVMNPKTFRLSAYRGLWYVSIWKKGTLQTATNCPPWRHYSPRAPWLEDLWAAHKLTHQQYLTLSRQFGRGHSSRRRDALDAIRDEREETVRLHVQGELRMLHRQGKIRKTKNFQLVEEFVQLFAGDAMLRRPLLAIVGGTNLGKSLLAADVLRKVASVLGLNPNEAQQDGDADAARQPYVEVTVEESSELDLTDFDLCAHAGVLLDGVGDVQFLKRHREVLQGRPKVCKGGKSGTMIYAYPFTLCRRAVVATFDLSAANLKLLRTDHWLSDPRNVLQLHLTEPSWESDDAQPVGPILTPQEKMASWTVDELARFLADEDLQGPSEVVRKAGVSGKDFLSWGAPAELQSDLHLAPFTAKKLLATRDAYLS